MKKAVWSFLPAKPEDIKAVSLAIGNNKTRISSLPSITGLSKTRTLCVVDHLIKNGIAQEKEKGYIQIISEVSRSV